MGILKNTQLQQLSTYGNLKQWDSYENLQRGLLGVMYSQQRQALIQPGLARSLPWKLSLGGLMHKGGSARVCTAGFMQKSPFSRKIQAPCPGSSKCSVTFLHIPVGAEEGARGRCCSQPGPLIGCRALGMSQSSKTSFGLENYLDNLMKYSGSGSSAWCNASVIWSSRSKNLGPGTGEGCGSNSTCRISPNRGCKSVRWFPGTSFSSKVKFPVTCEMFMLFKSFVKSC